MRDRSERTAPLTIAAAAAHLRVDPAEVERLLLQGSLYGRCVRGHVRVPLESIRQFLERSRDANSPAGEPGG